MKNLINLSLLFVFVVLGLGACSSAHGNNTNKSESQLIQYLAENSSNFAVIKFYAPWCGTCKRYAPEFSKTKEDYAKRSEAVDFLEVNVDDHDYAALIRELKIGVIPTTYFVSKDRKTVYNRIGNIKHDDLDALIQELLTK
ncbi:MAG: thioredoxin family protein [Candidatus Caenarcaniphilales bacterium]|nr:thioredoxin family protein [Candidatus Caenarcaniphilales bacterium]